MSRIGKLPISVPDTIKTSVKGNVIEFDNGKIKKEYHVKPTVVLSFADNVIKLTSKEGVKSSTDVGTDRSNLNGIVSGLHTPFKTVLEVNGVGYKVVINKNIVFLSLGYSHDIAYSLPDNVSASFEKPNLLTLASHDKIVLGQVASEIIAFRKPEPYKGKGVKLFGKAIIRKEGKKK